jgi:hypothetical protein
VAPLVGLLSEPLVEPLVEPKVAPLVYVGGGTTRDATPRVSISLIL